MYQQKLSSAEFILFFVCTKLFLALFRWANHKSMQTFGRPLIKSWETQHSFVYGQNQNLHWKLGRLTPSFGSFLAVWLKKYFFRNKTFLSFKIGSWNFQHLFEIEFHETSQNFKLLFSIFFYQFSDWVEILHGFKKFFF